LEQRKERFHVRFARKGGVARAKKLTAEQRRASASKPAKARWGKNHPDFAAPEQTPLKNAATPDLFDLQSISGIPSPDSLPGISEAIDKELMARFYNTLSDHHQQQFANNGLAPPDQQTSRDMNQLWDEFIITQARVIGHRIFLSRCCLQTILQWWSEAKNGPEFLLRLGKSLSMGARLLRGEAKAPVEAAHYDFRTDLVREIKTLQRLLKANPTDTRESVSRIKDLVHTNREPSPFPRLRQNWTSFESFLRAEPNNIAALVQPGSRSKPATIANDFIARQTNRDSESMRIQTSRAGGKRRTQSKPRVSSRAD